MRPYNIEFFDNNFTFRDHAVIDSDSLKQSEDYLDPENNKIEVSAPCAGNVNDYIRIYGNGLEQWGIIVKKNIRKEETDNKIEYTYKDFADCLDIDVVLDTSLIGKGTFEGFIADCFTNLFIESSDELQNIPGFQVEAVTATSGWSLDILPDNEEDTYAKVKLLDDVILPAFRSEFIKIGFLFDIGQKSITARIAINEAAAFHIEVGLPNVIKSEIQYKTIKKEINKDLIYNKKHYQTVATFFLHPDGTFDTEDRDRIAPIVRKVETVSTKTADEYIEKWAKELTSANSSLSSAQAKLDKGETLEEEELEALIAAAGKINQIPGIKLGLNESTGRIVSFKKYLYEYREEENAQGGTTVYINEAYNATTPSATAKLNEEGGYTVSFPQNTETALTYSKDTLQGIIDTYEGTAGYERQCEGFAYDEFMEKALEKATKTFLSNKYENNIEITCMTDDHLIRPYEMEIGQIVNIIDGDSVYQSILSGRKTENGETTLIFGTARIELTKILKGRS